MVILTYLANLIVDELDENANEASITQLFMTLFTQSGGLFSFCQSFPHIRMFLAPPNLRTRPSWYPRLRPTIIRIFHQFLLTRPPNLQLLNDYSGSLELDGVHFSILCGINFVKGLVDQAVELLKDDPPEPKHVLVDYYHNHIFFYLLFGLIHIFNFILFRDSVC